MSFKQVIVVRKDLGMRKGKMIAQGAHASLNTAERADLDAIDHWKDDASTKIVVGVESEKKLMELARDARDAGLPVCVVKDRGFTELEPGTVTAAGFGPADGERLDEITGDLNLL